MDVKNTPIQPYALNDRYDKAAGRVFLTGTQALVRILIEQAQRDQAAGLNTAGFVSGYRGSPLGALDGELWRNAERLSQNGIKFMPAINEDLAATAVLGAQQVALDKDCEFDGVFSLWYGKGPGVDRSGDALKHGNAYGSSEHGGVLVVAGDDHGCVSSSMPHQSDAAFLSWFMPILNPASVSEYLEFGEFGFALSRFSGTWVGFKAISETVESGQSVELKSDRVFKQPAHQLPPVNLHVRLNDPPSTEIESRMSVKLKAVEAFVETNPIDKALFDLPNAVFGFITTGKAHYDLLEALRLLGIDEEQCKALGIDIYKIGMVWPLARKSTLGFVKGKQEVLVVEEKRGIIESQLKEHFYDWPGSKPDVMVGKHDEALEPLIPWVGELSPRLLLPTIAKRLHRVFPQLNLVEKALKLQRQANPLSVSGANRTPYFCSGCPHNTSTKVPEGSTAAAGIGCHVMASWMDRDTAGFTQMGGEGVPWTAASLFNGGKHQFQNLGEGTWYHSGSLAIRQAIAGGANITFKILYNDAVAMTGGQPVDGPISPQGIAHVSIGEGVKRIALVSDDITKFKPSDFPASTSFHDRGALDSVQRELREIPGVSVIIYEQACATEKRRRRKRGTLDDPKRFVMINELVCEGCGDCSVESNCLSVEPVKTEFGTKRKINLSSCNKDFSCLNGFCPSFVTIEGGVRRKKTGVNQDWITLGEALEEPVLPSLHEPFNLLVAGVGGTGVVTIGAVVSMAAHLDGKGSSVLDFTGFAQKFGTVLGYVRIAQTPEQLNQVRIDECSADAVIGCDAVVCTSPKASVHYKLGTRVVLNTAEMPTGDLVLNRDATLKIPTRLATIATAVGAEQVTTFDANQLADRILGNPIFGNMILLGHAWQSGLVAVSLVSMLEAIRLNGMDVINNHKAFAVGRLMACGSEYLVDKAADENRVKNETTDAMIERRVSFLNDFQNSRYAQHYQESITRIAEVLTHHQKEQFIPTAAKSLFKLMAYKDEYEVARLHSSEQFKQKVEEEFEPGYQLNYHLSPPILPLGSDARGRPNKRSFGPWMARGFTWLAQCRSIRGSLIDPFRYQSDRKLERELIRWYDGILNQLESTLPAMDDATLKAILEAPMDIRGYGPVKDAAAHTVKERVAKLLAIS